MNEQEGLKLTAMIMTSPRRMKIDLPLRSLHLIVNALQLGMTHPRIHSPLREGMEEIGRHIQGLMVEALPEVEALIELGWHREEDHVFNDDDNTGEQREIEFRRQMADENERDNQAYDDEMDQLYPGKIGDDA